MRILILLTALCYVAMAQTVPFKGVTIGGTLNYPTVKNPEGNPPVIGYTALRHTDNGINVPILVLSLDWIAYNNPIQAGFERSMLGLGGGLRWEVPAKDPATGLPARDPATGEIIWVREGATTSYELTGVLFVDGRFYGTELDYAGMQFRYSKVRGIAKDVQATAERYALMENRPSMTAKMNRVASVDRQAQQMRETISSTLLQIRREAGEPEADKALARIAGLPDMVKGE